MDERTAIDRLKNGDIGGLEFLVKQHQVRAVRAAYLIVREPALAEDVVQSAFVRTYEKIGRFDPERPFAPWFMKIVVNDAIKVAKRRERTVSHEKNNDTADIQLVDTGQGPQELAEEAEDRRRVWKALEKLPPAQRAAIVQRYYLGMSEAEMARSGPSPPGTIKWRLHTARKSLSKILHSQFRAEVSSRKIAPARITLDTPKGGNDRD